MKLRRPEFVIPRVPVRHPERSEGSPATGMEIPRFARDDEWGYIIGINV